MLDYIVVGSGLAGIAFSETLLQNQKSFVVFENFSQNSSRVAGGLYNPVILKRFSQVWDAERQLALANQFYAQIEAKLRVKVDFKMPIYRKFFSIEEQNNWFAASDKPSLTPIRDAFQDLAVGESLVLTNKEFGEYYKGSIRVVPRSWAIKNKWGISVKIVKKESDPLDHTK